MDSISVEVTTEPRNILPMLGHVSMGRSYVLQPRGSPVVVWFRDAVAMDPGALDVLDGFRVNTGAFFTFEVEAMSDAVYVAAELGGGATLTVCDALT